MDEEAWMYLEQAIFEGVGKAVNGEGLASIPGCLHSWAGADIVHLANDIQLTQPAT